MNPQAFQTLEFDSLRALVRRGAQTAKGQGRIDALAPSPGLRQLQRALSAVGENIELRQGGSRFSFDGIADATDSLSRLKIEGAALEPLALLDLARLCERASEAIQEELVTVRNDRFVIPVRADHRGRINGVAHGSSSSGQTIFVEPLETIEANNELQSLREAEQREIAEILFALSAELRRELPAIERAAEAIGELDFINAKAAFADRFDCVIPEVEGGTSTASKRDDDQEKREDRLE